MALTPNSPRGRMQHVLKTYWQKDPGVVTFTLDVAYRTLGLEHNRPFIEALDEATFILDNIRAHTDATYILASHEAPEKMSLDAALAYVETAIDALPAHHERDFILPWAAREMSRLTKALDDRQANVGDWERGQQAMLAKAGAIAQWAKREHVDIGKVNLAKALEAVADYEVENGDVPQGEIIQRFPDGWMMQELRTGDELRAEGEIMQHCVGGYCVVVASGASRIFSLRDPKGNPHVTLEWRADTDPQQFTQIYGKQNEAPKEKYLVYVRDFIRKHFDGDPLGLLMAGERSMAGTNLEGQDLRDMDLHGIDLSDARLEAVNLSRANMRGADLERSILKKASLEAADLEGADLRHAVLVMADLRQTDFSRADLSHAVLYGALLEHADLRDTVLLEADLRHARLAGAWLQGANMTGAKIYGTAYDLADWVTWDSQTIWPDGKKRRPGEWTDPAAERTG